MFPSLSSYRSFSKHFCYHGSKKGSKETTRFLPFKKIQSTTQSDEDRGGRPFSSATKLVNSIGVSCPSRNQLHIIFPSVQGLHKVGFHVRKEQYVGSSQGLFATVIQSVLQSYCVTYYVVTLIEMTPRRYPVRTRNMYSEGNQQCRRDTPSVLGINLSPFVYEPFQFTIYYIEPPFDDRDTDAWDTRKVVQCDGRFVLRETSYHEGIFSKSFLYCLMQDEVECRYEKGQVTETSLVSSLGAGVRSFGLGSSGNDGMDL